MSEAGKRPAEAGAPQPPPKRSRFDAQAPPNGTPPAPAPAPGPRRPPGQWPGRPAHGQPGRPAQGQGAAAEAGGAQGQACSVLGPPGSPFCHPRSPAAGFVFEMHLEAGPLNRTGRRCGAAGKGCARSVTTSPGRRCPCSGPCAAWRASICCFGCRRCGEDCRSTVCISAVQPAAVAHCSPLCGATVHSVFAGLAHQGLWDQMGAPSPRPFSRPRCDWMSRGERLTRRAKSKPACPRQ